LKDDQLLMGSALDNFALLQHDDFVAVADRAQAVCDDDARATAPTQVVVDGFFGDWIERARRFIKDDDGGIGNQRPRNFYSLTLTPAEVGAAFIDVAVVVSGPRRDIFVNRRILQR
jgi:hypothetical protein